MVSDFVNPLLGWVEGNGALLGDVCHPVTPHIAQGASTSIKDAAVPLAD